MYIPTDLARVEKVISTFFQNGVHSVEYLLFAAKNSSMCWVNDDQHLFRGFDGEPVEIVGSWVTDITARKAAEEEKAASAPSTVTVRLPARPLLIYSYKAAEDFAPTFVGQNIRDRLGYEPEEYLDHPDFWRSRVHPDELAARGSWSSSSLFKKSPKHGRISISQERWHLVLGERCTAIDT